MSVMFDVDGVLAEFCHSFTERCHKIDPSAPVFGHDKSEKWSWLDSDEVEGTGPISPKTRNVAWREIKQSATFFLGVPSAVSTKTWDRIASIPDVYVVTARDGAKVQQQTEEWVRKLCPKFQGVVVNTRKKAEFAAAIQAKWSLEDKAGNAIMIGWWSPKTKSYLVDRPYNRFDNDIIRAKVTRVESVEQFLDDVQGVRR